MDTYLPADFYQLREDLREWCDAPAADHVCDKAGAEKSAATVAACADPSWRVF